MWVYNSASTTCQGFKSGDGDAETDAHHVQLVNLFLKWTGSFEILAVGPDDEAPDGKK